jgi:hypothetical protein
MDGDRGAGCYRALGRPRLPPAVERWSLVLPPGGACGASAAAWAGALVMVERGCLEVECEAGARRTFDAGSLIALEQLPLRRLRNPGTDELRLVAIRRADASAR